jgi:hypothetical protein
MMKAGRRKLRKENYQTIHSKVPPGKQKKSTHLEMLPA